MSWLLAIFPNLAWTIWHLSVDGLMGWGLRNANGHALLCCMIDSGLGRRTNVEFAENFRSIACSCWKAPRLTSFQDPGPETNFKGPEGAESLAKAVDVVFAHHAANRGESKMAGTASNSQLATRSHPLPADDVIPMCLIDTWILARSAHTAPCRMRNLTSIL